MTALEPPRDWAGLPFFSDALPAIETALAADTRPVLPPRDRIFAALARTPPERVRVVILGQDPYPTPGHANGLAFSVARDVTPLPRSLKNIFEEVRADTGSVPPTGDLGGWADQGVLLLNTSLTVPRGDAGGHARLGWDRLTREVLARLSDRPCAFLLWGRHAQGFLGSIAGDGHLVIKSAHPSPLSAHRGFFGSRPFSRVNRWLSDRGEVEIDWGAG